MSTPTMTNLCAAHDGGPVNLEAGHQARDSGMGKAVTATPRWASQARTEILRLAASGAEFTADDVVAAVGLPNESDVNANNAMGGVFAGASRAKAIERTGAMVSSAREYGHARLIPVWRAYRHEDSPVPTTPTPADPSPLVRALTDAETAALDGVRVDLETAERLGIKRAATSKVNLATIVAALDRLT